MSNDLGIDRSGNNNTWTVNNMTFVDQMIDTPTNNWCTNLPFITKFHSSYPTIVHSEGNLKVEFDSAGGGINGAVSNMAIPSTGKWYMERCILTTGDGYGYPGDGVCHIKGWPDSPYNTVQNYTHGGTIDADGDIYGVGYDADAGTVYWYKNGSQVSTASLTAGLVGKELFFVVSDDQGSGSKKMPFITNYGQDSSFAGKKTAQNNTDANGIGDFYYTVPTDFLALCTSNLAAVAVTPSKNFMVTTYAGNGSASTSNSSLSFQPDLLWFKGRSGTHDEENHIVFDAIRGTTHRLMPNNDDSETTDVTAVLESFDSDGWTMGSGAELNGSSTEYVNWAWKGGNAISGTGDFTQGTIASTCSRNVDAGFSIVGYTGSGSAGTIGHGLNSTPEMIITWARSHGDNHRTYHKDLTDDTEDYMKLNTDDPETDGASTTWNSTAPTADVFSVSTDNSNNGSTRTYAAYCWHSVDGYSKVGYYTGNGYPENHSATFNDGPFVHTGFQPKFVMIKGFSNDGYWIMYDSDRPTYYNPNGVVLFANVVDDEADQTASTGYSTNKIDFLSNGFKLRGENSETNYERSYLYIAFAETPFKYSNAR